MTRLTPLNPAEARDSVKDTLEELAARGGALGPMVLTMANSSALLRGYADLNRAMKRATLTAGSASASRWRSRNGSAALIASPLTARRRAGYD
jgi:hypothetical protein